MTETKNSPSQKSKTGKTLLKRGLIGFFAVILLLAIVLSTIDLEDAKNTLIEKVSAESGMKIEIESIGFGFAHGLGLKCSGVKVVTPKGETYAVDHLHLLAEWAPLLTGEFKINTATLDRPQLTLNLSDKPAKKPETSKKGPEDAKPGSTTPVKSAQEALKKSQLSVRNFKISDGQITLVHPGKQKSLLANLDLSLQLEQVSADRLDIVVDSLKVSTGELSLQGKAKGENLTAENAHLSVDLETSSFDLNNIKPTLAFFSKDIEKTLAQISELQIEDFSLSVQTPLAALDKPENLKQQSSGEINFDIKNVALNLGEKPLKISPLEGVGKWSKGILQPDIKGTALGSNFGIKGELPLTGKSIKTDINWSALDITQLPLPKSETWQPVSGNVAGSLNLDGPLPETGKPLPKSLKGKLNFQFQNLVLTNNTEKISLPRLEGKGDYQNNKLDYQLIGDIFDGNIKSNGIIKISKQTDLNNQTEFANLDLSKLNILKPGMGIPTQGKASGKITIKGPVPEDGKIDKLKIDTSFNVANLSVPMEHNQKPFPLEISQLKGTANLSQNQLAHDIQANMLGGSLGATGNLNIGNKKIADTTISLKTIDLSSLDQFIQSASGTVSADIKLKGPLPENGKLGNLKINTNFDLENVRLPVEIAEKSVNAEISRLKGTASLIKNKLAHDVTAKLLGGNVAVKGNVSLKESGAPDTVDTHLQLEHLDLAWVQRLKKGDWIPTSGKLSSNLKIKGPIPDENTSPTKLKASGTLTADKLLMGTGEKKNEFETAKLTLKPGSKDSTQALIEVEKIKAAGLQLKKVQTNFNINPKQIDLTEGRVFPQNGQLKLKGNFQPPSGNYKLQFQGDKLKIEDFVKQMAGPLNLQGKLDGKLPENSTGFPDIAKELSGQVKLDLKDGTLPELKAVDTLLTLLNPTSALQTKKAGLNYETVGGDFKIVKGLVNTKNFEMKSPQINLQVVGEANLGTDTVNAQVKAMPLQMLDKAVKAIPLLGQILTGGKKGGVIETYFKVDGKLSEPSVTMQAHKSLTEKPGAMLNELMNIPGNFTK
ncbi:MAG: AsmA family protein [Nitrospina sp.]|nr:AsmA family protein [Nitrospina sp.]MBT6143673.1 AsmA family protein [bacterium]MBT6717693.1 AsmA family protein [Nitrospina sp.]